MRKQIAFLCVLSVFVCVSVSQAAFIVEPHSSGLANDHFTSIGSVGASTPSAAAGLQATNSVFGGGAVDPAKDTYTFSYTPGTDADNWVVPTDARYFGNGLYSTNLAGGQTGYYNVYITWPAATNVSSVCDITVTSEGADVVWTGVDMNTGGTIAMAQTWGPFPEGTVFFGANDKWLKIADQVLLTAGNTYTVTQMAQNNTYVSMRSAGVMWEYVAPVPEPATMVLLGLGSLMLRRRQ